MNYFTFLFKELYYYIRGILSSPCKWMLIFYVLWVYRVSCMPAVAGGIAQGLQIATLFGMLYYAYIWNNASLSFGLFKTGLPVWSMTLFLGLGVISTAWSYKPDYSFFMSVEKLAFMAVFFTLFTMPRTFLATERMWVMIMLGTIIFNWVAPRVVGQQGFIGHDLPEGSCSAMCLSYCMGELLAKKVDSPRRNAMFRIAVIISLFCMFSSTSGGANASGALGVAIAFAISGKIIWGLAFAAGGSLLLLNDTLYDKIFHLLMQGKSDQDIKSSTGRTAIWEAMMPLANQKPWLGWGYASMERLMTDRRIMHLTDIHSNFYGAYGNVGIIGLVLLVFHHVVAVLYTLKNVLNPGFVGILCALCCGALNGYSYGFLVGKTAIISVFYLAFVMLIFVYQYTPVERE